MNYIKCIKFRDGDPSNPLDCFVRDAFAAHLQARRTAYRELRLHFQIVELKSDANCWEAGIRVESVVNGVPVVRTFSARRYKAGGGRINPVSLAVRGATAAARGGFRNETMGMLANCLEDCIGDCQNALDRAAGLKVADVEAPWVFVRVARLVAPVIALLFIFLWLRESPLKPDEANPTMVAAGLTLFAGLFVGPLIFAFVHSAGALFMPSKFFTHTATGRKVANRIGAKSAGNVRVLLVVVLILVVGVLFAIGYWFNLLRATAKEEYERKNWSSHHIEMNDPDFECQRVEV